MSLTGGCYCGAVRYRAEGAPTLRAQCHCRECQYITGGGPNYFMMMPLDGFGYTQGAPRRFTRADLPDPVTREFCDACGTHLVTRKPGLPFVVLKIGTLDEPARFEGPQVAIFLVDGQPFHQVPEGVPAFERMPPR
ncbi:GFA family protein [Sphingomonas solaris]|uniref:GFA family protein n=1 Tax=Alterirhizorhabdus solaris TaxID=2529389 RepID=A0A558RBJ3_9SPHN|nr:GFA family protein [Sphingomonas solaris]TVV76746.1 GFA family protein [Sphingomonas solaris]